MEGGDIDINVIDEFNEADQVRPSLSRFPRRKVIFIAAGLLIGFLVIVAVVSTAIALGVTLGGSDGDDDDGEDNGNNPSPPSPPSHVSGPIDLDDWYEDDGITLGKPPPPMPDPSKQPLRDTMEYQITLEMSDVGDDRDVIIGRILTIVSNFTGLPFNSSNGAEAARNQHTVSNVKNCVDSPQIRVRDYVTGSKKGGTTVDIKGNSGSDKQGSEDMTFYPGPAFPDSPFSEPEGNPAPASFQKVEKDVHPCDFKYSRETRIFFQHPPAIETCHDLLHMFPWAFPNLPTSKQSNKVSTSSTEYWWVLEHSAYLYNSPGSASKTNHPGVTSGAEGEEDTSKGNKGTRCESTVTLKYKSLNDAIQDKNPSYGEWSLRIYATNDGLGDWDNTIVTTVNNMYQQMLNIIGDPEYDC